MSSVSSVKSKDQFKPAVPRAYQLKGKRRHTTAYVESLERQLVAAEARLRYFEPSSAGEAAKDWRWGEEGTFTSGGSSPEVIRSSPRNGTDGILEGYLKEEELSLDKNRYLGTGSGLHLAKSISDFASTTSPKTYVFEVQTMQLSLVERLILEEQRRSTFMYELPPDDLGKALVEAFFSRVNPNMGLLHRPSFDRAIRDGSLQRNASFRNLFFLVCALATRFVEDERLNLHLQYSASNPLASRQSKGFQYFRAAWDSVRPALTTSSLYDLQSSALAPVFFLVDAASATSVWACVGFAIRRIIDAGGHRESRARWNLSPLEDQLRRRALHFLFGLDRCPLALRPEDSDVADPIDISDDALDDWDQTGRHAPSPIAKTPGQQSGILCLHGLRRIMARTLSLLYGIHQPSQASSKASQEIVMELDSMLNEWLNGIPEHLQWSASQICTF